MSSNKRTSQRCLISRLGCIMFLLWSPTCRSFITRSTTTTSVSFESTRIRQDPLVAEASHFGGARLLRLFSTVEPLVSLPSHHQYDDDNSLLEARILIESDKLDKEKKRGSSSHGSPSSPPMNHRQTRESIYQFVTLIQDTVTNHTLDKLLLTSSSNKQSNKERTKAATSEQKSEQERKEALRGCIRQVHGRLIQTKTLKKKKTTTPVLLQLTVKYFGATDIVKNVAVEDVERTLLSILLPTSSCRCNGAEEEHQRDDNAWIVTEWGGSKLQDFGTEFGLSEAKLSTIDGSVQATLRMSKKGTSAVLKQQRCMGNPTKQSMIALETKTSNDRLSHDRRKQVPLTGKEAFVERLGLGKPKMRSKLRQCQKFVEIVAGLVETQIATSGPSEEATPDWERVHICDMGCGRAYLTFALHHYLSLSSLQQEVETLGIDVRPALVEEMKGVAKELGYAPNLAFQVGTIETALEEMLSRDTDPDQSSKSTLEILIALHACDTATDDALWYGIHQQQADIIVVVPCCHKQIRKQLDFDKSSPMADVLKYGIYQERWSETLTDSLRAMLLEYAGYKTHIFEFVGGDHTDKNVMITAIKTKRNIEPNDEVRSNGGLEERIRTLAGMYGVRQQKLADWMGVKLTTTTANDDGDPNQPCLIKKGSMPPL